MTVSLERTGMGRMTKINPWGTVPVEGLEAAEPEVHLQTGATVNAVWRQHGDMVRGIVQWTARVP